MSQKLLVSKSKLDNTLNEYDKVYSSALTWNGRMEKENNDVLAADCGQAFVAYGDSTSAFMNNDLSDFIGHVNIMKCALTESLSKTNALIARSEDFANVLRGEGAMDSDSYASCSSSGDLATFYDDHCPEEAGYEGSISKNTQNILDLGIKEEEELVSIENELLSLKTVSVSVGGQAAHIRNCIQKQNYTDPLFNSLKSYGTDVRLLNNYVTSMNAQYFPSSVGARTHVRSYDYSGAPSGARQSIYECLLTQKGYSIDDVRALEQYLGLSSYGVYQKLSSMSASDASKLIASAATYVAKKNPAPSNPTTPVTPVNYEEYHTGNAVVDAEIDRLFNEYGGDLDGIIYDIDYDECNSLTKHALAVIFDKNMEKINNSFSDDEVRTEEKAVSRILELLHNGGDSGAILDDEKVTSFKSYLRNDVSKQVIDDLLKTSKYSVGYYAKGADIFSGAVSIDVKIDKAGIVFQYVDNLHDDATQMYYHTNEDRSYRYIVKSEKENPGCYDHEYGVLKLSNSPDRQKELAKLYCAALNETDMEFLDKLFRADDTYEGVFDTDPTKLSDSAALVLAEHSVALADDIDAYLAFANIVANNDKKCSIGNGFITYAEKYAELMVTGSANATTIKYQNALAKDYTSEAEMRRALEIASQNELFWTSVYAIVSDPKFYTSKINISIDTNGADWKGFDLMGSDSYSITFKTWPFGSGKEKSVVLSSHSGLSGIGEKAFAKVSELQRKKAEAAKDIALNTAINVVGVYCKPAGIGLSLAKNIYTGYGVGIAKQAASGIKSFNPVGGTLFDGFVDLYKKISDIDAQQDAFRNIIKATLYYSVMEYEIDLKQNAYVEINNFDKIKGINKWDEGGYAAFYNDEQAQLYNNYVAQNMDELLKTVKDTLAANDYSCYSDDYIKKAFCAVFYGADNKDNPCYVRNNPTFGSVTDIPEDLRNVCIHVLNYQKPDEIRVEFADKFNAATQGN